MRVPNRHIKNIPNYITLLRIVGTVCLMFVDTFSVAFFVVYTLSGISDAVDGWIARKLKITSECGAKLDSIADILFYGVMVIKIFPVLLEKLPLGIWIVVGVILCLRFCTYVVVAWKYKSFASLHTYMNKITGGGVFLLPYVAMFPIFIPFCGVLSVIAGTAVIEEILIHIRSKECHTNVKSIWETDL